MQIEAVVFSETTADFY